MAGKQLQALTMCSFIGKWWANDKAVCPPYQTRYNANHALTEANANNPWALLKAALDNKGNLPIVDFSGYQHIVGRFADRVCFTYNVSVSN